MFRHTYLSVDSETFTGSNPTGMNLKLFFAIIFFGVLAISSRAVATPDNIAPKARVTASTILSNDYSARNVTDGIIGVPGIGEWACLGDTTDWGYIRFPWIQLEWEQPQQINRIVLFDRP